VLAEADSETPATTGTPAAAGAADASSAQLIERAREHYDRALAAQRAGDWATYGAEIARLGEVLRQLRPTAPASGASGAASPGTP
jgi:uncharacterized membrane protein (UPF0182 family)